MLSRVAVTVAEWIAEGVAGEEVVAGLSLKVMFFSVIRRVFLTPELNFYSAKEAMALFCDAIIEGSPLTVYNYAI